MTLTRILPKFQRFYSIVLKYWPGEEISTNERNLVVKYKTEYKSFGEICKLLKLAKSTVQSIFEN